MSSEFTILNDTVRIDTNISAGPFEWWRHSLGHGGINSHPLPDRIVKYSASLKPRLIRTFIQEYFNIYPDHSCYDWSRLDPYMDFLAATGAKVVAAITIKPGILFPKLDQAIWLPSDINEWQKLIFELVKRYSIEKQIVTYWEIGNETDIGEHGGCPYLIRDAEAYHEYYRMTIQPVLEAFPEARVGGPALANISTDFMEKFIHCCYVNNTRLDFVSWHLYHKDPALHTKNINKVRELLSKSYKKNPEMLVTEWNVTFDSFYTAESAYKPQRAVDAASIIIDMLDAELDWSFYYHVWDQVVYFHEFEKFFSDPLIMHRHWNETPHRFGLFGVEGEVRPQYFIFQMLSRMGDERLSVQSPSSQLKMLAAKSEKQVSLLIINTEAASSQNLVVPVQFTGLKKGLKRLKVYRVDEHKHWQEEECELLPIEKRPVDTLESFYTQIYAPCCSVTLVVLEEI